MSQTVSTTARFTDADLRGISSLSDAMKMVGPVEEAANLLGNGFRVLATQDKSQLVGVNFLILDWQEHQGDSGPFVSIQVITERDEKVILNDGSTGVYAQVKELGDPRPIIVRGGLRRSDFFYNEKTQERSNTGGPGFAKATTFYLNV